MDLALKLLPFLCVSLSLIPLQQLYATQSLKNGISLPLVDCISYATKSWAVGVFEFCSQYN
jgi:hypothetical protein